MRKARNRFGIVSLVPPWLSDKELREMGLEVIHEDEVQEPEAQAPAQPEAEERRPRRRR